MADDLYWVGGDASTDWSNGNNWSNTSGGAGGDGPPTREKNVHFDFNGSGNCYLTEDSECSGIYCTDAISYDFFDDGYQLDLYSRVDIYPATQIIHSTGEWYQKQSVTSGNHRSGPSTSNRPYLYVLESGITATITAGYFHVSFFKAEADTVLNGEYQRLVITYPTRDHFCECHPTFSNTSGMRWYVGSTTVKQSGYPDGQIAAMTVGYGGSTGATLLLQDHMKLRSDGEGSLQINASNGAITEAQARKVDMNGYNLECGTITLGAGTSSYNGYAGMIRFGTGTHEVTNLSVSYTGTNKNTYAYWDWGSGVIAVRGYIDLEVSSGTYTHDGAAQINLVESGPDAIHCSGAWLPTVHINKYAGNSITLSSDMYCEDLKYSVGNITYNGYNIQMPQRVRPLTLGGLKTFIGKKWVNG